MIYANKNKSFRRLVDPRKEGRLGKENLTALQRYLKNLTEWGMGERLTFVTLEINGVP